MSQLTLKDFTPDPERLTVLAECIADYGIDEGNSEWTNNIISKKTVVYGSGVIAKHGQIVDHNVDPKEFELCQQLAYQVCQIMGNIDVGMGSESSTPFQTFYIVANIDTPIPEKIDIELIHSKFAGTIFPPAIITVEPVEEAGIWWSEVLEDFDGEEDECLQRWLEMIAWFQTQEYFKDTAFVRIGDYKALYQEPYNQDEFPEDIGDMGCVFPRFAVGLTHHGSLAGIFGFSVQT
ncbi:MAG: hypothetical protein ACRDB1_13130 [Microcoleaceae cyanobacterium]